MNEDVTDIDALMDLDPLELSKQDLDKIIAYQRKQRAQREQGVKVKKHTGERPASLTIEALLKDLPQAAKKPGTGIKRR